MEKLAANRRGTLAIRWGMRCPCLERGKPATNKIRRKKPADESVINFGSALSPAPCAADRLGNPRRVG